MTDRSAATDRAYATASANLDLLTRQGAEALRTQPDEATAFSVVLFQIVDAFGLADDREKFNAALLAAAAIRLAKSP